MVWCLPPDLVLQVAYLLQVTQSVAGGTGRPLWPGDGGSCQGAT